MTVLTPPAFALAEWQLPTVSLSNRSSSLQASHHLLTLPVAAISRAGLDTSTPLSHCSRRVTRATCMSETSMYVGCNACSPAAVSRLTARSPAWRYSCAIVIAQAALAPLDWANIRGHTQLLKAIEKVRRERARSHVPAAVSSHTDATCQQLEDSQWLPKFVDDLIRGIIRYKIKLFKPPPKPAKLTAAAAKAEIKTAENTQSPGAQATDDPTPAASSTVTPSPAAEPTSASTNATK